MFREAVRAISDSLKRGRQAEGGRRVAYNKAKKACSSAIHHAKSAERSSPDEFPSKPMSQR